MKTKKLLSWLLLCVVSFTACKKEGLLTYDTDDSVFFKLVDGYSIDSIVSSFGRMDGSVATMDVKIPVGITGVPATRDRRYKVIAGSGSTALPNVHYEQLSDEYIFRAGRVADTLTIRFLRTADLKDAPLWLNLQLVATNDFSVHIQSHTVGSGVGAGVLLNPAVFRLRIDDIFSPPPYWLAIIFGTFSVKKMALMIELLNLDEDAFETNTYYSLASNYWMIVSRYLAEQKALGNTIYEDDGSEMSMAF